VLFNIIFSHSQHNNYQRCKHDTANALCGLHNRCHEHRSKEIWQENGTDESSHAGNGKNSNRMLVYNDHAIFHPTHLSDIDSIATCAALRLLGINECYHGWQPLFENPRDNEMWMEALEAKYDGKGKPYGRAEFDKLLGHCQGVSDMPAILFADELVTAYPEAKVILTHRNFDTWYKYGQPFAT
jgi:hypothetical protein